MSEKYLAPSGPKLLASTLPTKRKLASAQVGISSSWRQRALTRKGFNRPTHSNEVIVVLADNQSAISFAPAGPILHLARPRLVSLLRCFSMRTMLRAASSVNLL